MTDNAVRRTAESPPAILLIPMAIVPAALTMRMIPLTVLKRWAGGDVAIGAHQATVWPGEISRHHILAEAISGSASFILAHINNGAGNLGG